MKNNFYILSFATLMVVAFFSCKKERADRSILSNNITPNELKVDAPNIALQDSLKDNTAMVFTWTAPDYGFKSSQTYTLEVDLAKNDFKKGTEKVLYSGTQKEASVTHKQADDLAKSYGIADSAVAELVVRVKTKLANYDKLEPVLSKSVQIMPRRFAPPPAKLYVAGDFQGWNPGAAPYLLFNKDSGKYIGIVDIIKPGGGTGEFKFTSIPAWTGTNYGKGANAGDLNPDPGASNLAVNPEGTYRLTADVTNLKWTSELVNWGLIGDATNSGDANGNGVPDGWETDLNMSYDNANNFYTITTDLGVGAIKFRLNDSWSTNLGDDGNDLTLEPNGANIPISAAGNYTIKLKVNERTYTITKN